MSHRNLISGTMQFDAWLSPTYEKIPEGTMVNSILALPLYHFFAFMVAMVGIRAGHHFTLITNPRDIDGFVKTLASRPFHLLPGVNTLFQALIMYPDIEKLDFSSLFISLSGGMAATPATSQKWIDMTGTALVQGWGMTETVGVDDTKRGQAIKAFVVRSDTSLTEDELIEHCHENLTGYKRPRHIEFCDELPKSSVGKILRNELRKKTPVSG